jgi:hypothetical protein
MNKSFLVKLILVLVIEALLIWCIIPLLQPKPDQVQKAMLALASAFLLNFIIMLGLAYYKKTKGNWVFVFLFASLTAPFLLFFIYDHLMVVN